MDSASPAVAADGDTPVTIDLGGITVTGRIGTSPAALDLAAQLPLTLPLEDFNGVEKIAELPRALDTAGEPAGADPEAGDIGYYAPTRDLVLYYGDVGYYPGIVRLGRLDADPATIAALPDGTTAVRVAAP